MKLSSAHNDRLHNDYGPWAVVTGASSGLGKAHAEALAEAGLHLVLVARRQAVLDDLAAQLRTTHGIDVRVVPADLTTEVGQATVEAASHDLDVGLLIAAAGFGTAGRFLDADLEAERAMLAVNADAVLRACLHFGRRFADRGRGGIVLFGSIVGYQGTPYAAHYAATKAYVQTLAEALHVEWAPLGVDVLASAPGPVHTGFADRAGMEMGAALTAADVAGPTLRALGRRSAVWPGWLSKVLAAALVPLPRWARTRIMAQVMGGMTATKRARAA